MAATGWPRTVTGAAAAGIATAAWLYDREGPLARYAIAIAQVMMVSLLVWLAHGQMQIDVHMYYFATFAMLAAFCDWQVIVLAAGVTALHHLGLNFLMPLAVFPDGANLARVVLHAGIVVIECAVLTWLTVYLAKLLSRQRAARWRRWPRGSGATSELAVERQQLDERTRTERQNTMIEMAERFEASIKQVVEAVSSAAEGLRKTAASMSATAERTTDRASTVAMAARAGQRQCADRVGKLGGIQRLARRDRPARLAGLAGREPRRRGRRPHQQNGHNPGGEPPSGSATCSS